MAEDRFPNIFNAEVTLTAANALTFAVMNFGIAIRDKLAIVVDQVFFWIPPATIAEMTTTGDSIAIGMTNSDQPPTLYDFGDRRVLFFKELSRMDFGTAAGGMLYQMPMELEFAPPMINLPTRLFMAAQSIGLATALTARMRMHFRTVPLTSEQQLQEVLEVWQLTS